MLVRLYHIFLDPKRDPDFDILANVYIYTYTYAYTYILIRMYVCQGNRRSPNKAQKPLIVPNSP